MSSVFPVRRVSLKMLADTGLLFEINRAVLHPMGLELRVSGDAAELHQSENPGGAVFSDRAFAEGEARLMDYMIQEGCSKLAARKAYLQFVEQVDPDQGPPSSEGSGSVG